MRHIHVCLVSDQTVPNILGIHHFSPDELLFVTTEEMERKGKVLSIVNTLNKLGLIFDARYSKLIIREDSILDCQRKIDHWIQGKEDAEFVINLTCGTKIMSIATYEYFKDFSSRMIYIPLSKNEFIMPFPIKRPSKPEKLGLRLNVVQYLTAYGLDIIGENKLANYGTDAAAREELSAWIVENYEEIKNLLVWLSVDLRRHRANKKVLNFSGSFKEATKKENDLLEKMGFSYDGNIISKDLTRFEIRYLTGGWLEEFCFNVVSKFIGKGIDDVVIGIKLKNKKGRENEFDVMFTKDNALYFVECKSLDQHYDKKTEVLYKIGALQKEFGLRVGSFLVTTSPYILEYGKLRYSVQARAEQFNTTVIPPVEVFNFQQKLSEKLNIICKD